MKVHLRQIPEEGLHLEGVEDAIELDIGGEYLRARTPVHYVLDVGISGTGLFATGKLAVDLELECVSCLEKFSFPMKVADFALQTELEGSETVDLTPFMREDILLNLPYYPRCDWDGRKVCEGTLKFKNSAITETPLKSPAAADAWNELDKLKVKKNK